MSGEEAAQQKLRCFPDILVLVFRLSDGKWRTLMGDVSIEVSELQFASLCTHLVISVAKSAMQRYMPTLIRAVGMETALMAEEKLKEKAEPESMSLSGKSTTTNCTASSSQTSAERSSVDQSDRIRDDVENFVSEVKVAMEKSIYKVASSKASPLHKNWKTTSSLLDKDILNILEAELTRTQFEDTKSRETSVSNVSQIDDLTFSCTNDTSGGIKRLYQPTTSHTVCNIPALNTGSAMLIRPPRRTTSPIFQLNFNSCTDKIIGKVVELNKSELLLSSSSKASLPISTLPKQPSVKVTTVKPKDFFTEAVQVVSGATSHEDGMIFEKIDSASQTVTVTQPQSHQRLNLISDEIMRCHGPGLTNSTFIFVRNITGPSYVWNCSLDSVREPSWIRNNLRRDLIQVPSVRVNVFVDSYMKMMYLHVLSLKPESSNGTDLSVSLTILDQDMQGPSTSFEAQESSSNKPLSLTYRTSGETEDPLALLVNSEQAESERIDEISAYEVKSTSVSPTPSSKAGSQIVQDTLENLSTSSQETCSSSSSPLNDPEPVGVKKRSHRFHFYVGKKAPFISFGQKKSTKANPAGVVSQNHQSDSTSGNLQESVQRELTVTPFKKTRKRLSRMFSAVCKALPNPFTCMTRPS